MKKGFTLSEVLITLGVIGVVAAMTLSTTINKMQLFVLKNQYKKVYTNYTNALQKYINDNDGIPDCAYGGTYNGFTCIDFYTKFLKNFKTIKYCANHAFTKGCVPRYSGYGGSGCNGFSEDTINNTSRVWILNDGSSFITYDKGTMPIFAIDVNGLKGPNKGGYDLFPLAIEKINNTVKIRPSTCLPISSGGIDTYNKFLEIYK